MILIWGLDRDGPLTAVRRELAAMGAPVHFLDQRQVLDSEVRMRLGSDTDGWVRTPAGTSWLADVTSAYVRPYDAWRIGAVAAAGRGSEEEGRALAFDDVMWSWAEMTGSLVVNRPSAMAGNGSKPYQALTIREHGFGVPETLLTTDVEAVADLVDRVGTVVYKSVSGTRSIVRRLGPDHDERLPAVVSCPTQFQALVPGEDHRVHVVGDDVFCCRIVCAADDYRYGPGNGAPVAMQPVDLDDEWADRCRTLVTSMDLSLGGLDLRLTPEGEWVCFEVNPSPAFTYYDRFDQGIAHAVAALLAGPRAQGHPA